MAATYSSAHLSAHFASAQARRATWPMIRTGFLPVAEGQTGASDPLLSPCQPLSVFFVALSAACVIAAVAEFGAFALQFVQMQ